MRPIRQLAERPARAPSFFAAAVLSPRRRPQPTTPPNPAARPQGATVATPPEKVSVTFNNDPLALGSQIQVKDAAGTNWAEGPVEIVDNVASQKLRAGAPAGQFTVVWRVVSSDSHPIEGTFTFTATAGAAGFRDGGSGRLDDAARLPRRAPPSPAPPRRRSLRRTPPSRSRGAW